MLGTMYQSCVAAFNSCLWNVPIPIDQVLDDRIVQMHVKIAGSGGHPNSIQGRNPGTCCNCCITKDHWEPSACSRTQITCASGQATTYTTKHGYSGVVKEETGERNGTLLSSVMRVGSVCMWMMDVHIYNIDQVSAIFRSAFTHDMQAPLQASWFGGQKFQLAVRFGVSEG